MDLFGNWISIYVAQALAAAIDILYLQQKFDPERTSSDGAHARHVVRECHWPLPGGVGV